MKKSSIACLFMAVTVLSAGCGSQKPDDRIRYPQVAPSIVDTSVDDTSVEETENETSDTAQTSSRTEKGDKINHGHSITERSEPDPSEIMRSKEVLYDEKEAEAFLLDNITYPEGEPYTFEMTDSSIKDRGAYLWYDFTVFYAGVLIEGSEFTVITFNDGTIIEGDPGVFRAVPDDLSGIKTPEEILKEYAKQYTDSRNYKFQTMHYLYQSYSTECTYVYVYRYHCGNELKNATLTLNAKNGELLGYRQDAID